MVQTIDPVTRKFTAKEAKEFLKNYVYISIISADNEDYTEETKQKVIARYHERPKEWEYILDPLGEDKYKYLKLFTE